MKRGAFLFLTGILFTALLAACYVWLCRSYEAAARKNQVNAWNRQRFDDFYKLPPHSLDLVFIGSSHSYCSFDPEMMKAILDIESFQMGMPLQHPDCSYYTLREVFETQSPGVVVMEIYWDMLDDDFDVKQADTFFQVLRNETLKAESMREMFPWNEKIKYAVPLIRYRQDFWVYENKLLTDYAEKQFGLTIQTEKQVGEERYAGRGFMYCDYTIPKSKYGTANQFYRFDGKKWKFSEAQQKYLTRIIQLCREKGARLIFVTAPVPPVSLEKIQNYHVVSEKVADFAAKYQVPYWDFNQIDLGLTNENFRDDAHLNYSGVLVVDRYLARLLVDSFRHK